MWVNLGIGKCVWRITEGLIWRGGDGVVVPESGDPFLKQTVLNLTEQRAQLLGSDTTLLYELGKIRFKCQSLSALI